MQHPCCIVVVILRVRDFVIVVAVDVAIVSLLVDVIPAVHVCDHLLQKP